MKRPKGSLRQRRRFSESQRTELLTAFERDGLSAKAFARKHGIGCSTLHAWRRVQPNGKPSPGFVQVELSEPRVPVELVVEMGAMARLRITSMEQIELAAQLVHHVNAAKSC